MSRMILTVIGGGSVNWMRGLMRDVYLMDEVEGGEIRLVDPNREHTEAVAAMLAAFNRMRDKNYKISIVEDRKAALTGADFVMTTFSPGRMDAYFNDLEIPVKYGIRLPVSMTVGVSGISAALRTAPVAYEIVQDMEEVCPGAWLLNVTNPMTVVTRAMNLAARRVHVLGFCHGLHDITRLLGPILGLSRPEGVSVLDYIFRWLPEQGFQFTTAGLNHFIWLVRATWKGEDMLPRIRQFARDHERIAPPESQERAPTPWENDFQATLALCRRFGFLPIGGDRHHLEFIPSLCNVRNGWGMKYGVFKTTVDHRRHLIDQYLARIRRITTGEEKMEWIPSDEELTGVMRAILTRGSMVTNVNLPNRGQIDDLPRDVVVETFATVTAEGVTPHAAGALPGGIGTLCRLHAEVQELTLRAALEGSRELLLEALSLDPHSAAADFEELSAMADELLLANRPWLPRFFS